MLFEWSREWQISMWFIGNNFAWWACFMLFVGCQQALLFGQVRLRGAEERTASSPFSPLLSCLPLCVYFSWYPPNGELACRLCFLIHREENITGWLLLSSRLGILFKKVTSLDAFKSMWCGYARNACMYIQKVVKKTMIG